MEKENTLEMVEETVNQLMKLCEENNLSITLAIIADERSDRLKSNQIVTGGNIINCFKGMRLIERELHEHLVNLSKDE